MKPLSDISVNRKLAVGILVLASALLLVVACNRTAAPNSSEAPVVRIGWQTSWATQGQLAEVLQHTNALTLEDLRGDLKSFQYGAPLSEAALANDVDVAFLGDQPAVTLLSSSKDWRIVARLMDFRVAILVPPNSPIKSVVGLKGKTLAIPFGSSTHRVALEFIAQAGLNPQKDVHIINIDIQEQASIVQSARSGQWPNIDAVASWDPNIALYESKGLARVLAPGKALGVVVMSRRLFYRQPRCGRKVHCGLSIGLLLLCNSSSPSQHLVCRRRRLAIRYKSLEQGCSSRTQYECTTSWESRDWF